MTDILSLPDVLIWPFLASVVLAGIHVYFGIHVIARNVIFVDLALAQIAALGAVVGIYLGYEHGKEETAIYLYSIAFTLIGAAIFSISRSRNQTVPVEAIVGITYTVAFALTLIILSKSPIGSHELDRLLKGDILWVTKDKVVITAIIYAAVGLFHYLLRKQFFSLTFSYETNDAAKLGVRFIDFLFYMSFGVVVASSVSLVGVFLVFSYLVIPSVTSMLIFPDIKRRLIFGWIFAVAVSFVGMKISWHFSLPSTPLIVILFAVALAIIALVRQLMLSKNKKHFAASVFCSCTALAIFCLIIYLGKAHKSDHAEEITHLLESGTTQEKIYGLKLLTNHRELVSKCRDLIVRLTKENDRQLQAALCELFKETRKNEWDDVILTMLQKSDSDFLSCWLELAKKKKIPGSTDIIYKKFTNISDADIQLELIETLLDMHYDKVTDDVLKNYTKFHGPLREDLLKLLNDHYHTDHKSIEAFGDWWRTNH
ncbi:MAG: metal ABC transporter permease [Planctomycetes bacterium]|nr:metal ABC transporter permease [Planctomycetota bacterium]